METFNNLDLNSFFIEIKTLPNKSKDIYITYNDFDFSETGLSNLSYTYNTTAKRYENLQDGIVDTLKLSATQKQGLLHSIKTKLYNLNKNKKPFNNMREHIIESAVKNATSKKDKDLDISEFDFDDFNFGFEESLVSVVEQDKNQPFLDEIKEIESQIKTIDERINNELNSIVEAKIQIEDLKSTIFHLENLIEYREYILNDGLNEKINLKMSIERLKTNLQ